jgi:hypothetical protein
MMWLEDAQREMRDVYLGGSVGGFVSGGLWLASATLASWSTRNQAVWALIIGGMLIFPVTMMALRFLGRRATASRENPLNALAMQVAFTVPLAIPLILVASRGRPEWFYPGFLIVVGAHYLPFVTLYGQPAFYGVAAVMVGAGFVLPMLRPDSFALGGWLGGAMLVLTGVTLGILHARELASRPRPAHSP